MNLRAMSTDESSRPRIKSETPGLSLFPTEFRVICWMMDRLGV